MHNAQNSGKLPKWTFEYWNEENENRKGEFDIDMTRNMAGDENKQSKQMNDAAIALVKKNHTDATSVLLKR
jgi:hypothetical protein